MHLHQNIVRPCVQRVCTWGGGGGAGAGGTHQLMYHREHDTAATALGDDQSCTSTPSPRRYVRQDCSWQQVSWRRRRQLAGGPRTHRVRRCREHAASNAYHLCHMEAPDWGRLRSEEEPDSAATLHILRAKAPAKAESVGAHWERGSCAGRACQGGGVQVAGAGGVAAGGQGGQVHHGEGVQHAAVPSALPQLRGTLLSRTRGRQSAWSPPHRAAGKTASMTAKGMHTSRL